MNLFNKAFLKKVSIVLSVDIFSKILSFILLPIYLVLMPKIEFGEFTFIYITAITTSTLMSLNFYVVIIKDLSKEENILLNKKKFSTLFIFIFVFNILLLITSLFIEYNFKIISGFYGIELFKIEKVICILVIIILNVLSLFQYSLILSRKKTYEICFYILGKVIFSNLITLMLLKNVVTEYDTVLVRLFGILIGEFIHIIFIQIIVRKSYLYFYLEVNYLKKKFKEVLPLIISTLISLIMISSDRKILQIYYGNEYLAEYNLVYILLIPMGMIVSSFQSIWNPQLFNIKDFKTAFSETIKVLNYLFIFLVFVSGSIFFIIKYLFEFGIIKDEYFEILPLFLTMIFGFIFGLLLNFIDSLNLYLNKNYYKLYVTVLIGIIFILLNIILIPKYAHFGISISLFISNFIGFVIGLSLIYKNHYKNEK